ncbi:hypothetical protein BDB01DRAFT_171378 [Pilobolus umbonatus]|nr:hypothetical protein BDB01DRAFT_171378 [Pilobolus umbonatus]
MYSYHSNSKSPRLSTSQPPARQPSQRESNAISSPPSKLLPRLKPSRSNQSLKSTSTNTSQSGRPSTEQPSQPLKQSKTTRLRKPSPATHIPRSDSNASIISHTNNNKNKQRFEKIVHSTHNSSDENESCGSQKQLTRSSSNGSSITERRRTSYSNKRLKYPTTLEDTYFMIDSLRDDLEKEKSAARALQGQKEAIARDLDYFCEQADEISLERDEYKRKYEEEKAKNEQSVSINRSQ